MLLIPVDFGRNSTQHSSGASGYARTANWWGTIDKASYIKVGIDCCTTAAAATTCFCALASPAAPGSKLKSAKDEKGTPHNKLLRSPNTASNDQSQSTHVLGHIRPRHFGSKAT